MPRNEQKFALTPYKMREKRCFSHAWEFVYFLKNLNFISYCRDRNLKKIHKKNELFYGEEEKKEIKNKKPN